MLYLRHLSTVWNNLFLNYHLPKSYIKWHHLNYVKGKEPFKHMRTAKVQARLRIRTVSPEPLLFANTCICDRRRGNFSQRTRDVVMLYGRTCALED